MGKVWYNPTKDYPTEVKITNQKVPRTSLRATAERKDILDHGLMSCYPGLTPALVNSASKDINLLVPKLILELRKT